ncbi:hypothetical protein [Celeribacter sp.]|uniref:hypothetical protein n=1 Tax=Celeribacter sp. TaxID=1890673 RepID=UPI003A90AFE1
MSRQINKSFSTELAQTGLAAVRHANLDLADFGATNRMTGPSPSKTFVPGAA